MGQLTTMPERTLSKELAADDTRALELLFALQPNPRPADPVTWKHRSVTTKVITVVHLAALIGPLSLNQFGVAKSSEASGGRWAQVMNVSNPGEWACIVEFSEGGPDDFAQRVFRGTRESDYPLHPGGLQPLHDFELFTADVAARIIWEWLHVGLEVGLLRTYRHLDADSLARYGLI